MSTVPKKVSRRSLLCNCCNNDDACAQNVNQFGERQSVWCHQGTRTENWNLVPLSHNFLLPFLRCRTIIPTYFKAIFRPSRPTEQTNRPDGDLTWYTCQTNKMELGHPAQRCRKLKIQMFPIEQAVPPILFSRWFRIYINLHKVFKYGYFAAKWNPHHCVCRIINSVFKKIIHGQRETYGFLGPHGDIKCLLRALPTRPKISGSLLFCSRDGRKGRMFENVPVSRSVTCSNSFAGWRHVHKSPN